MIWAGGAGTRVNGKKISRFDRAAVEKLSPGPNRVMAGSDESAVGFLITLSE